jgi:hypothetical protein
MEESRKIPHLKKIHIQSYDSRYVICGHGALSLKACHAWSSRCISSPARPCSRPPIHPGCQNKKKNHLKKKKKTNLLIQSKTAIYHNLKWKHTQSRKVYFVTASRQHLFLLLSYCIKVDHTHQFLTTCLSHHTVPIITISSPAPPQPSTLYWPKNH